MAYYCIVATKIKWNHVSLFLELKKLFSIYLHSSTFVYIRLYLSSDSSVFSEQIHYLCSADLLKSFSQLIVLIFIFSQYFFQQILPSEKMWGYRMKTLYEKCSLFYLKRSFRSQNFLTFCIGFSVMQKKGLIRKIRLTSELMTSQPGRNKQL